MEASAIERRIKQFSSRNVDEVFRGNAGNGFGDEEGFRK